MKLNIKIQKYLEYFPLPYIMIGLICFMQGCFIIVIFSASFSTGIDYAKQFTILKTFPDIFSSPIVFVVLFCITSLLALSSYHFFSNFGRIIDSIIYFSYKGGKWFNKENIPFVVAIDIHSNPTSKIRFAKQTFVFGLLFSICFTISYHLTTVGTAKEMTAKITKTNFMTEKQLKNYSDSSKVAINNYYDTQILAVRKKTNFSLEVAENKIKSEMLLLNEKQTALLDLQNSINEIRKEQKELGSKEAKLYSESESKGKVIGGFFEFAVIICSLIIQVLNPKEKDSTNNLATSPTLQPFETMQNAPFNTFNTQTINENLNENTVLNEKKASQIYIDFANNNKELAKLLYNRVQLSEKGIKQDVSFSEIANRFGFKKSDVSNLCYQIRDYPNSFKSIISETVIDNFNTRGEVEWQNPNSKR